MHTSQTLRVVCVMYGRLLCSGARQLRCKGRGRHHYHQRLGQRQAALAGWLLKSATLESLRSVRWSLSFLLVPLSCNCSTSPNLTFLSDSSNLASNACVSLPFGQSTAINHCQAVLHYSTWRKLCTSLLTVGGPCCAPGRCIALLSDCNAVDLTGSQLGCSPSASLHRVSALGPCKTARH